jgi:cytochrome P450
MAYGPISLAGFGILIAYLCFMVYQWFTLYLARRRIILENGCKPIQGRYPHRDPILGLDYIFEALAAKNKGQFLLRECGLIAKLGATYIFYICGVGVVSTAEPENMKAILATSFDDFGSGERNAFLEPVLGTGIFTTDGEEWAHSRAMIRPSFTRSQIADLDRLEECMDDMLALIPSDGTEIDLQPLFFGLMMDSASAFLLGQSVQSLRDDAYATGTTKHAKHSSTTSGIPSGSEFAHAYETAQEYRAFRFLCGPFGKIGWQPKVERNAIAICRTFIESFADDAIRYRKKLDAGLADEKKGYTFLNELAKETKDRIQLRDEVMNVLTAGRDTTASMLSNLFHHLAKRPEIWAKLRTEVATLNGALPSFEQLKGMTYLQYCIKECLLTPQPCSKAEC